MFVSFFALHVSVTRLDHHQGLNVPRLATCSPYVVFLHNLTLMVSLVTETCRAKKDTNILMFLE